MSKYAILAFVAVLSLGLVQAENHLEKSVYQFKYLKRLGHFVENPFVNLYKNYAFVFMSQKYEKGELDDLRNFRPTAAECRLFFTQFVADEYKLKDLEFLVPLDACLGYVLETPFEDDPDSDPETVRQLKAYKADEKITSVYATGLDELDKVDRTCLADLLHKNIQAKSQYPDTDCNNHYLQLYIQFAECQDPKTRPESQLFKLKDTDTYVKMVYDLVKSRTKQCFDQEINHINLQMRDNKYREFTSKLPRFLLTTVQKQAVRRNWSKPVYELLLAIEDKTANQEISVVDAAQVVFAFGRGDEVYQNILYKHIAKYVDKVVQPRVTNKPHKKSSPAYGDPRGEKRYTKAIDNLCRTFRSSDREKDYDFATSLVRMVRLLKYEELFGISQQDFLQTMIMESEENGVLYVCVSACNILSYTYGQLDSTQLHYRVTAKPDVSGLPEWPVPNWI